MPESVLTRRTLTALALAAVAAPALAAKGPPPPPLTGDEQALVSKAIAYLQSLSSGKGDFVQTDARGAVSQGTFYLQRPGKARFAYQAPASVIMASDGHTVSIYNERLKTFQSYPLSFTPLALFLAKEIRLDRGVKVISVHPLADGFTIVAADARRESEGKIALTFADPPMRLAGWTVTDAQGQSTRVRLQDFAPTSALPASLFQLHDPRPKPGSRP